MMFSPNDIAHLKIPFEDIRSATNNFADANIIDFESKLAKIYKGQLLWSGELIDINARKVNKEYTHIEFFNDLFWTEVSMLSRLRHPNLVSFVGFCDENVKKIVITKHERGRLIDYLRDPFLLTWVRRLKISVGLAHALSYIHYDEPRDFSVIHRNIDSATVVLSDDWEPKLGGFMRSMKIKASERHHSFNTDKVRTDGYGDPTYTQTTVWNHKSDIYSFGIVMFQLLCGRKAVIDYGQENKYLASMAVAHYREEKLNEIIDWDLWNQMDSQSFNIFAEIAYDCLNEERSERPNIDEIVRRLEKALELQLKYHNEVRWFFSSIFLL
ncbi:kinase-like domain, phloem protein 2-like protein [Tanacetum coccineum]